MKRLAILFFLISFAAQGQDKTWDIEATGLAGFLMPHHTDLYYIRQGHVFGGELSLTNRTDGSKDWHHRFFFPRWGFSANIFDLGSEYLGNGYSGKVFFDLPLTKRRFLFLKISLGAGVIQRPFNQNDNVRNGSIGSYLNASLGFELLMNFNVGDKLTIRPGIGIHHFSNGSMKIPNTGINLCMLSAGVIYKFNPQPLPELLTPAFTPKKANILVGVSAGMKERPPIDGKKYGVFNVFGIYQKRITGKSSFGGELGVNYNESLQVANQKDKSLPQKPSDNVRFYVAAVYQLHFDPLSLRFNLGSYLAPNYEGDGLIFLRYHLVYDIKRFQVFAGLKSHYAKADNAEFGIGYRIR